MANGAAFAGVKMSAAFGPMLLRALPGVGPYTASAVASELMGHEDRPWRIWAAARAREFADRDPDGRNTGAWGPACRVTDACSLATAEDWQYIDAEIIEPLLRAHGAGDEIDAVRDAIGAMGHTVMVLAPWERPYTLTRAWCLRRAPATLGRRGARAPRLRRWPTPCRSETLQSPSRARRCSEECCERL